MKGQGESYPMSNVSTELQIHRCAQKWREFIIIKVKPIHSLCKIDALHLIYSKQGLELCFSFDIKTVTSATGITFPVGFPDFDLMSTRFTVDGTAGSTLLCG